MGLKQINSLLIILLAMGLAAACTTTKSRSDMSALSELYHNTTAHYNGYFNANELYELSVDMLNRSHVDNYIYPLPMYKYLAADDAAVVTPDLDNAMQKLTIVVNLHPYSKWVDDSYLLFGKAQYLKRDYETAEETFRYFAGEFNPEAMDKKEKKAEAQKKAKKKKQKSKKKKKSKKSKNKMSKAKAKALKKYNKQVKKARKSGSKAPEKPAILQRGSAAEEKEEKRKEEEAKKAKEEAESKNKPPKDNPLKHQPAYYEGMLYYAKTLIERNKYDSAQRIIDDLNQDPKTFAEVRSELAAVQAHLYIHKEAYVDALSALQDAIEQEKDKQTKARYAYIMAQIYQRLGNSKGAYAGFEQALSYRPGYVMDFNCRLNMAQNAWASGVGSAKDARASLDKMLKEDKNAEFKDQIYFALAMIAFKENDRPEGIRNLELSLQHGGNKAQKAEAYLTLADFYFEEERYVSAKYYYDSTMTAMPETDERYARVNSMATNLADIAENLEIIALQDSLLAISKMTPEEQTAMALRIKKKQDEERRKALIAEANRNANQQFGSVGSRVNVGAPTIGGQESTFFAYDDRRLKRGQREFQKKWGNRPLTDNWRRAEAAFRNERNDEELAEAKTDLLTQDEVAKLLGDVPKTEGEVTLAEIKVQEAMAKLGSLYRERLDKNEKAIEILETLLDRFSKTNFELEAWYQLYVLHNNINEPAKAQAYADKILDKYPTSPYALIIKNPNYADELMRERQTLSRYYEDTYAAFKGGKYQDAYQRSLQAKDKFGAGNAFQPKFALLAAMSTGNIEGKDAYIAELRSVISRFPDTEEQTRAREILRLLGESTASLPVGAKEEMQKFTYEEDKLHYLIIAFKSQDINLTDNKVSVSDYNEKYHRMARLRISNIYLGNDADSRVPILVLRRFKDKNEAMAYYKGVEKKRAEFIKETGVDYELFPLTQDNYREVLKERSLDTYRLFFQQYYLN